MTEDQPAHSPDTGAAEGEPVADDVQKTEEELRAELEEEIAKVRIEDVLLQSVISILNLTARRISKEDERDLEQARIGIDASRAVVDLLPEEPREQVRQAISELQMLYAKHTGAASGPEEASPPAASD